MHRKDIKYVDFLSKKCVQILIQKNQVFIHELQCRNKNALKCIGNANLGQLADDVHDTGFLIPTQRIWQEIYKWVPFIRPSVCASGMIVSGA